MISGQVLATFDLDPARDQVVLTMNGQGDLVLGRRGGLAAARERVELVLNRFRIKLDGDRPSLPALVDAVTYLEEEMGQVALMLTDDSSDLLGEVRERLVTAWPRWQSARDELPVIEIRGHDEEFPFELVPLFDARSVGDPANFSDVEDVLRRFPAFCTVVRRTVGETVQVAPLRADPVLPVQLFTYRMSGVDAEAIALGGTSARLAVEGPWPGPELAPGEVVDRLIDALYDPNSTLDGNARTGPAVQVQHFAAHCQTTNRSDDGYTLLLGGPDGPRTVTLADIRTGFRRRTQESGRTTDPRPLVVCNACGSAKIDKTTRRSFPRWFLRTATAVSSAPKPTSRTRWQPCSPVNCTRRCSTGTRSARPSPWPGNACLPSGPTRWACSTSFTATRRWP
jgi:hypothetical protein